MEGEEYSQRLGRITPAQFQAALTRFGLGTFQRAYATSHGLFGQNVFVTSDQGEWVLRGAPHYDWQLPTEQYFARLLHERTDAPTPWPYFVDPATDIFGWSYALMPRMPGHQVRDAVWPAPLGMDDRIGIAAAMGETLADLHALTWPDAGRYNAATDSVDAEPDGYSGFIIGEIERRLAEALTLSGNTTQADVEWARDVIAVGRDALAVPYQPCIVFGDYHPGNVTIAGEVGGRWRVSGVFDLMTLAFGDGEADLARLGRMYAYEEPQLARVFFDAFLARRPARPGFALRFPVYALYDCLIIWTFCLRNNDIWWPADMTLRG